MATDVDQSCYGWSHEELTEQDNSQEISVSQMLDHGSISFGRFALEPLSWEKRSVFTHNRYLEELEKFRAPGLVAQKKAYFEEYYKRIRAMKALQENQHTEPPSYCGGSNCIAGQIGEEDQRVVPSYCGCGGSNGIAGQIGEEDQKVVPNESDGDEMVKAIDHGIETEVTLDIDGATALVEPDSPAKFSKDDKKGRSSQNSKQWKILDINLKNHEPITTSIEDSGQNDFRRVDNKQEPSGIGSESISRQIVEENQRIVGKESHVDELEYAIGPDREKASIEVPLGIDVETASLETDPPTMFSKDNKTCKNSGNSMQFQFLDRNSCDHEPITASIEDSKKHGFLSQDNVEIPKKSEKYVTHDTFYPGGSPKVLELKLNTEQKKVKQAVKGFKGIAFTSEVMGHSSPAGDLIKSELKNKSVTLMLAQALRDSSQKRNGKNYVCNVSHKQTVDRILSSKHASVASHGSNKEICSKVTPRPFCFATGKQASPRSDTKNILSSSSLPPKNISSKGISSRPGIPYVLKREKLESRRGHEEHGRKLFATDRQATHRKEGSASNVIRPLKARSVNLPPKGDTDVGTNYDRLTRNNEDGKRKLVEVANDEACLKEARGHGKPTIFCVLPRSQNSDNIKLAPSRIRDLSLNTKNSRLGDNSLDIRKPRPEKPRWR